MISAILRRMTRGARTLAVFLVALTVGCASPTAPSAVGSWGGADASLVLSASGGAVSYGCGAGTIDSGWTLGNDGAFAASGQHFFGGGPEPVGGRPPHPARYAGVVQGDTFTLSVTLTDQNQTLGPFHMMRGASAVFLRCL